MLSSSCRVMDTEMVSLRTSNCSVILKDGGWYAEAPPPRLKKHGFKKTKQKHNTKTFSPSVLLVRNHTELCCFLSFIR